METKRETRHRLVITRGRIGKAADQRLGIVTPLECLYGHRILRGEEFIMLTEPSHGLKAILCKKVCEDKEGFVEDETKRIEKELALLG